MITQSSLEKLKQSGLVKREFSKTNVTFRQYADSCIKYMYEHQPQGYVLKDAIERQQIDKALITEFVQHNPQQVTGYMKEDTLDTLAIIEALVMDITYFKHLTPLLEDDSVGEIQINDYKGGIFYNKPGGGWQLYKNDQGVPVSFESPEELKTVIDKLIDTSPEAPKLSQKCALVNARTYHGYRISATHPSVYASDLPPYNYQCVQATIRKIPKNKFTMDDLIRFGTLSKEMADFLYLIGRTDSKVLVGGATGSGKTTLLYVLVKEQTKNRRVIAIQNPTENLFYERDAWGNVVNNVVHWDAKVLDVTNTDVSSPTMANLESHALRNTPDIIFIGELRSAIEFSEAMKGVKCGHILYSSLHVSDSGEVIERMVEEIASVRSGADTRQLKLSVGNSINFSVIQQQLRDGRRRVLSIDEFIVQDEKLDINPIFKFEPTGETIMDEYGNIREIKGEFKQVGVPSKKIIERCYLAGVDKKELAKYLNPEV